MAMNPTYPAHVLLDGVSYYGVCCFARMIPLRLIPILQEYWCHVKQIREARSLANTFHPVLSGCLHTVRSPLSPS
jgi:hypothetical protein